MKDKSNETYKNERLWEARNGFIKWRRGRVIRLVVHNVDKGPTKFRDNDE